MKNEKRKESVISRCLAELTGCLMASFNDMGQTEVEVGVCLFVCF